MRISGGELGGRKIKVPRGAAVRPTQERVREALFSMLMEVVPGAFFVDLFAGTGSVGLEALSRGARRVIWVEKERRHAALLRENVMALKGAASDVCCLDAASWLAGAGRGVEADVVFADPPYVKGEDQGFAGWMDAAARNRVLHANGFFVAEMSVAQEVHAPPGWTVWRDRSYGHTRLALYRLARVAP